MHGLEFADVPPYRRFWERGRSRNSHYLLRMTSSSSLRTRSTTFDAKWRCCWTYLLAITWLSFQWIFANQPRRCHQGHVSRFKQFNSSNRRCTLGLRGCSKSALLMSLLSSLRSATCQCRLDRYRCYCRRPTSRHSWKKPNSDKGDITNYRPISNLSVLLKLLKRVIT